MFARLENGMTTQTLSAALLLCSAGMTYLSQTACNSQLRRRLLAHEEGIACEVGDYVEFRREIGEDGTHMITERDEGFVKEADRYGKPLYTIYSTRSHQEYHIFESAIVKKLAGALRTDNTLKKDPPSRSASKPTKRTPGYINNDDGEEESKTPEQGLNRKPRPESTRCNYDINKLPQMADATPGWTILNPEATEDESKTSETTPGGPNVIEKGTSMKSASDMDEKINERPRPTTRPQRTRQQAIDRPGEELSKNDIVEYIEHGKYNNQRRRGRVIGTYIDTDAINGGRALFYKVLLPKESGDPPHLKREFDIHWRIIHDTRIGRPGIDGTNNPIRPQFAVNDFVEFEGERTQISHVEYHDQGEKYIYRCHNRTKVTKKKCGASVHSVIEGWGSKKRGAKRYLWVAEEHLKPAYMGNEL